MNIMFMKNFADGTPTNFVEKILSGLPFDGDIVLKFDSSSKLHTIRQSKRVKPGMRLSLRYWEGKPYRSKQVEFMETECISVQDIKIEWYSAIPGSLAPRIFIDGKLFYDGMDINMDKNNFNILARNDGFENGFEFLKWFHDDFDGQIIHWTDLRY